ncbi:MAG: outer membrane beta-barrel protein [Usitatibacteraceae bacterium]
MRTIKTGFVLIVAASIAAMVSAPTHAQYYGGLPLYSVQPTLPSDANNLLFRSPLFSTVDVLDHGGSELKMGYRFSSTVVPHLALVGQHADASRWSGQRFALVGSRIAQRTNSYGLDLVASMPLFDRLSMTGSAGIARVRADSVFGGVAPIGLIDSNVGGYTSASRLGMGVQYDLSRSLGFRFEVERYRNLNGRSYGGSNPDADTFTFGMRIRF